MVDLKAHLKDRDVTFLGAADGALWYTTELGFEFPVPMDDMGEATFAARDRAMLFMRYVRKHAGVGTTYPGPRGGDGHEFTRARAGQLWYRRADGFEFPVPYGGIGPGGIGARVDPATVARFEEYHAGLTARAA